MTKNYRIRDFYAPVLRTLQDGADGRSASDVVQLIIALLNIQTERSPELWGNFRLKIKNKIRIARVHLTQGGFLHANITKKGLHLTYKGQLWNGKEEEADEKLMKSVRMEVRRAQVAHKSAYAINNQGQIVKQLKQNLQKKTTQRSLYNRKQQTPNFAKNTLFYGTAHTGKTFQAIQLTINILGLDSGDAQKNKQIFREKQGQNIEIIAGFGQINQAENLGFNHIFKDFAKKAMLHFQEKNQKNQEENQQEKSENQQENQQNNETNKVENFVFIVDGLTEMDSNIFGELGNLLDETKRIGAADELSLRLSTGELIQLSPNLYVIVTATSNYNLYGGLLPYFEQIEMLPKYNIEKLLYSDFLQILNQQIAEQFGHEAMIGHTIFIENRQFDFMRLLNTKIIPLFAEKEDREIFREQLSLALFEAESTKNKYELLEDEFGFLQVVRSAR